MTFPILTRILSKEEYGILGLVTITMSLLVAAAKAGLSDGIIRFYDEYSQTTDRLLLFCSTIVVRGTFLAGIITILYLLGIQSFYRYLHIDEKFLSCFLVMASYLFVRPLNIIVLNFLRVTGRTVFYNAINFFGRVVYTILTLTFLLYVFRLLYGYFIGWALAEILIGVVLAYWFFTHYNVSPSQLSWKLTRELLIFGVPVLLAELSFLLLSYVDRYMIIYYLGEASLGVYSVGYTIANYVSDIINTAVAYAVVPIYVKVFTAEGRERTEEFLGKCTKYLLILMISICTGYLAVSRDLIVTLASMKYEAAAKFSPIVLIGTCLLGLNSVFYAGLYLQKRTGLIFGIMLTGVVVNIILNMFLLPTQGVMGAAVATLVACAIVIALTVYFAFRYINIPIDWGTIGYYSAISMVMYFGVGILHFQHGWINLVSKTLLGVLIIAASLLFREKDVRMKILQLLPKFLTSH